LSHRRTPASCHQRDRDRDEARHEELQHRIRRQRLSEGRLPLDDASTQIAGRDVARRRDDVA
jgi:hypothetical protein